jgi:hypothetical protein
MSGAGGARLRSNAPDPNALRRNLPSDQATWTRLPNRGLDEVPEWPVEIEEPTLREQALWNRMWRDYPQAHIWRRQHSDIAVAVYVRIAIFAAGPDARAPILTAFRQQSDALLLNALALRSARYIITDVEQVEVDMDRPEPLALVQPITKSSIRDRMLSAPAVAAGPDDEDEDDPSDSDSDEDDDIGEGV